jgi:hypothetical protein
LPFKNILACVENVKVDLLDLEVEEVDVEGNLKGKVTT